MTERMRATSGFSLLELMLALAIVAILAAIAYPSYGRYGFRARRAEAQILLLRIATAQERYYAGHNKYAELGELGFDDPAVSEHRYYRAEVALDGSGNAGEDQGFVATAMPDEDGAQQGDACGALSIDHAGRKLPAAEDGDAGSNGSCW